MRKLLILTIVSVCILSCNNNLPNNNKLTIVCTTGMIGDAVKNITQGQANVITLMGPGVDPHLYKATQGDIQSLSSADIIIYNGLHLEGKMGEIFEKLQNRKHIIVAANAIPLSQLISSPNFQSAHDPHLWFDVSIWAKVSNYIGDELAKLEGFDGDSILNAKEVYITKLEDLHSWVADEISTIPERKRVLITAHDAFGYFGRAYNIEVKGLQGISTLSEYGLKDVSELVHFIVDREIKAVFVESSVSDRALKAVAEGSKQRGHDVKIGGTLYSDAMGEAGTAEGEYIGMVKFNVNTIVKALK